MSTASPHTVSADPLAAAAALGPVIEAAAADTEGSGRVSPELLAALRDTGVFRLALPHEVGGAAADLPTILAVYEEITRHDGSTGWISAIGSGTNLILTALAPEVVRELFAADPDIATGGTWMLRGRAVREAGGYRVSGRWPFGSGCEHCGWLIGGCAVHDDDGPVSDDGGRPVGTVVVFPRDEAHVHDTWQVSGLRGTGSHDYEVEDLFVPEERSFRLLDDRSAFSFPHARLPLVGTLAAMLGAVVLGMARGAIDTFTEYARSRRIGGDRFVKDLPLIRVRVAEAEALVRSARAFVFGTSERVWDRAVAGEAIPDEDDLLLRLAASHASRACGEAIQLMFAAGGTAALHRDSPLQRFQRDIQAAQQHAMIAFYGFEGIGRELLERDEG